MASLNRNTILSAVILPTLGTVVTMTLLIGGFLEYATSQSDRLARDRQIQLVEGAVRQRIAQVSLDQEGSTLWDDAVIHVRSRPLDKTWVDNVLGVWFHEYYHHDEVYLLDGRDRPIYAMQDGLRTQPEYFSRASAQAMPLVRQLRTAMRQGPTQRPTGQTTVTGTADLAVVAGRPAVVSIKPFISDSGDIRQAPGDEHLHISVVYLDRGFIARLSEELGVSDARFGFDPAGQATIQLKDKAGRSIGYIIWSPFEPGRLVRNRLLPVIALALALIGALLGWLLWRNRRSRAEIADLSSLLASRGAPITQPEGLIQAGERDGDQAASHGVTDLGSIEELTEKYARLRPDCVEARESLSGLSQRQREVLDLVAQGLSNKEAARVIGLSPRTVEIHRSALMGKLGAKSAVDLARIAIYATLAEDFEDKVAAE